MANFSGLFMFSFVRHFGRCLVRGSSPQGHSFLGNPWRTKSACLGSFVSISHRDIVAFDLLVDQDAGSAAQPIGTQLAKNLDFHRLVIDFDFQRSSISASTGPRTNKEPREGIVLRLIRESG